MTHYPGADLLEGGAADEYLAGEAGDDTLDGGMGSDTLAGGAGDDTLVGSAAGALFFGDGAETGFADTFDVNGGVNWIMDFEPGIDRIDATLPAGRTIDSIATQVGEHLLLDFSDGGGQVWLANTTLAELAGIDVLV